MDIIFLISVFVIAFLYSSAGHGGASGYLAIMALYNFPQDDMRSTALILNVFVSLLAFISFFRAGYFRWRIILPFIIASVPMSYLGARIDLHPRIFNIILGILLVIAILRILYRPSAPVNTRAVPVIPAMAIGIVLGFFSGLIGIGGGIILSPLLILLRWADLKETAAASALFIFVNSISGLAGLWSDGVIFPPGAQFWLVAGITGGLLGSYAGSRKFSFVTLKYTLSAILLVASIKLFIM